MARYAVVRDGVVDNMIVWDGVNELSIPNSELIEATDDARIGGSWDGNVFTFISPPLHNNSHFHMSLSHFTFITTFTVHFHLPLHYHFDF